MSEQFTRPRIGIGVYIRKDGKILFGKRIGAHAGGMWAPPGGHLEMNESWEECVVREVEEETGLKVKNMRFMTATNDIYPSEERHYVTVSMVCDWDYGEEQLLEPEKCAEWRWCSWDDLPDPLMTAVSNFIKNGYNPLNF